MASRSGGRILIDQLAIQGVRTIFGVPGESYLEALDALVDSPIRFVTCRQEGGAAMAAEAYGKLTGQPGVCFVTRADGRQAFLADRIELHPAAVVDGEGRELGSTEAVELVTIGQRRGLTLAGGAGRRYVTAVDVPGRRVVVGERSDLLVEATSLVEMAWAAAPLESGSPVRVQTSAHGAPRSATWSADGSVVWAEKTVNSGIAALYAHAKGLAAEIGFELHDLSTGGGSDGNFTAHKVPTLDGLGVDGNGAHTLGEHLYISSLVPRMTLQKRLFETLS